MLATTTIDYVIREFDGAVAMSWWKVASCKHLTLPATQSAQALLMSMRAKAGVERHEQTLLEKEVVDKQDRLQHAARLTQGASNNRSSSEHQLQRWNSALQSASGLICKLADAALFLGAELIHWVGSSSRSCHDFLTCGENLLCVLQLVGEKSRD